MLVPLTIVIAFISLLLIVAVILQNPKGGGLDSTFGGGQAANQMFGAAKSSDLIERITWTLAAALIVLCLFATFLLGDSTAAETGSDILNN